MANNRKIEVFMADKWHEIDFKNLRKGNKFRLFNKGLPYKDNKENTEWIALSDPCKNENDIWTIDTQGVQHQTTIEK